MWPPCLTWLGPLVRRGGWGLGVTLLLVLAAAPVLLGCGSQKLTLEQPTVEGGSIRGTRSSGLWTYLGIPYAAPPVGDLRWKPPRPVAEWTGVRPAVEYGPSCPQDVSYGGIGPLSVGPMSEDCLYLNVWTPARTPDDRLPVMVWIHGGSFTSGSGSMPIYSGEELARKGGVVVVTINYRLGPFGFLAHPALSAESANRASGNYGLLDQIAALSWVRDNIAAFGGDRDRVTAFGESAGAISILDLMASPLARGLFQGAIVQSAILLETGMGSHTGSGLQAAERAGSELMRQLGVEALRFDDQALRAMRELTADELLSADPGSDFLRDGLAFKPVVDGYVLPQSATQVFAEGRQMDVPLLIGSNADEGELFVPSMGEVTPARYRAYLEQMFGDRAADVFALYPAESSEGVLPALSRLLTEVGFASTARFAARSMGRVQSPAYVYEFTRIPDVRLPGFPRGAFHGLEIPYVFGKVGVFGVRDPVDISLSEAIMDRWTRFAADGDPNAPGLATWPAHEQRTDLYLELGDAIAVKEGLYPEACDLADAIRLGD